MIFWSTDWLIESWDSFVMDCAEFCSKSDSSIETNWLRKRFIFVFFFWQKVRQKNTLLWRAWVLPFDPYLFCSILKGSYNARVYIEWSFKACGFLRMTKFSNKKLFRCLVIVKTISVGSKHFATLNSAKLNKFCERTLLIRLKIWNWFKKEVCLYHADTLIALTFQVNSNRSWQKKLDELQISSFVCYVWQHTPACNIQKEFEL